MDGQPSRTFMKIIYRYSVKILTTRSTMERCILDCVPVLFVSWTTTYMADEGATMYALTLVSYYSADQLLVAVTCKKSIAISC